jgi:hypothetical protein
VALRSQDSNTAWVLSCHFWVDEETVKYIGQKKSTGKDYTQSFLGAFAKSRKAINNFVISVHPSLRPSVFSEGTTWLPLVGFSSNVTFDYFSKAYRENSNFIKIGQDTWVFYIKPTDIPDHILLISSQNEKVADKIYKGTKTHFTFNIFFAKILTFMR